MDNPFGKPTVNPFEKGEAEAETKDPIIEGQGVQTLSPVVPPESEGTKEVAQANENKPIVEVLPPSKTAKQLMLEEYGGLESNVPLNSAYWKM